MTPAGERPVSSATTRQQVPAGLQKQSDGPSMIIDGRTRVDDLIIILGLTAAAGRASSNRAIKPYFSSKSSSPVFFLSFYYPIAVRTIVVNPSENLTSDSLARSVVGIEARRCRCLDAASGGHDHELGRWMGWKHK